MSPKRTLRHSTGRRALGALLAGGLALLAVPAPAANAATPTQVSLAPSASGPVGASVTANGAGFPTRKSGSVSFAGKVVATFKTNNSGVFSASFKVPSAPTGPASVVATATSSAATTYTVQSSTPPPPPPPPPSGFVKANGRQLTLNGSPYRFTGIDYPSLSTDYNINYGCGETNSPTDVTNFFASLRPNSMVRVWAFQSIAYSKATGVQDFQTLDRVVNAAAQSGQKVILTLGDQWGTGCGEVYKTESWYASDYTRVVTDGTSQGNLTNTRSYSGWVQAIVSRYANSPGVGMWEPINEPYPSASNGGACSSTAASTLRTFFDAVGGQIHTLDPNHLVSSGLQGSGQCGSAGVEYQTLHQSPGIDVATVHDYYAPSAAMGGDQWNGLQVRVNQMAAINKPLFTEEVGIDASDTTAGAMTLSQRSADFKAKMDAQLGAGMVGYIPWEWSHTVSGTNYHIAPGDPTLTLLHNYTL